MSKIKNTSKILELEDGRIIKDDSYVIVNYKSISTLTFSQTDKKVIGKLSINDDYIYIDVSKPYSSKTECIRITDDISITEIEQVYLPNNIVDIKYFDQDKNTRVTEKYIILDTTEDGISVITMSNNHKRFFKYKEIIMIKLLGVQF